MIDRQRGNVIFACDTCGEVLETNERDFADAFGTFKEAGWKARKPGFGQGTTWLHVCPDCVAGEANHTCHAVGCNARISPKYFMCPRHWGALPKHHQDAIWQHYAPGQEVTKRPTREYVQAANEAIAWLAEREGKTVPKVPQGVLL